MDKYNKYLVIIMVILMLICIIFIGNCILIKEYFNNRNLQNFKFQEINNHIGTSTESSYVLLKDVLQSKYINNYIFN